MFQFLCGMLFTILQDIIVIAIYYDPISLP